MAHIQPPYNYIIILTGVKLYYVAVIVFVVQASSIAVQVKVVPQSNLYHLALVEAFLLTDWLGYISNQKLMSHCFAIVL